MLHLETSQENGRLYRCKQAGAKIVPKKKILKLLKLKFIGGILPIRQTILKKNEGVESNLQPKSADP
jgi:hypothetical protein